MQNSPFIDLLTLNPLTWRIWWAPNNASKWQMGFNSAFKGLNQLYMFRATNSPIFRSMFWLYIQLLVQCTDIAEGWQQYRCIVPKAVYTVKKCSWIWAS